MLQVDLVGIQADPQTGAAVLVLREHDAPNRLLPIVVGGAEAASIALAAQGQVFPRPMTHDLMATLVERFDGHLDAVEVVDVHEGAFIANLAVSGPTGDLRLDTRPSDAIALAVRLHAVSCLSCRRFARQLRFLRTALRHRDAETAADGGTVTLSPEAQERIQRLLLEKESS